MGEVNRQLNNEKRETEDLNTQMSNEGSGKTADTNEYDVDMMRERDIKGSRNIHGYT